MANQFHGVLCKPLRDWLQAGALETGTMGFSNVPDGMQEFFLELKAPPNGTPNPSFLSTDSPIHPVEVGR